jgi:hypothetical protein
VEFHRKELRTKYTTLDLKAAAWLAGFPINNAEIVLSNRPREIKDPLVDGDSVLHNLLMLEKYYSQDENERKDLVLDFIGPSMDTGFRVSELATSRKFAVTVDLAYMLAFSSRTEKEFIRQYREPSFRYDGRIEVKDVDGGPYPFFWIDMNADDPLHRDEDALLPKVDIEVDKVESFCEKYFQFRARERGHVMLPYIFNSSSPPFNAMPELHQARLQKLISALNDYKKKAKAIRGVTNAGSAQSTLQKGEWLKPEQIEKLMRELPAGKAEK